MMAVPMPDPLRPAHLANRQIPLPLSVVLARAMAVDRDRRYSTAAEMREALLQAQRDIEEAMREEQRQKEEAARRLAEQQRLAEEARQRAIAEAAEAERRRREAEAAEAERRRREEERRQQAEAEQRRKEKEEIERKQREEAERQQRLAREHELAEQRRREEETRQRRQPPPLPPKPPGNGRKRLAILAGAALLVLLLGYWLWQASHSSESGPPIVTAPASTPTGTPAAAKSPQSSPATAPSQSVEVLRYAQIFESKGNFRLRFTPQRDGYLYLFGLDEHDKPITLLTNRHAYDLKAQANRLTAGTEFIFPTGSSLSLGAGKSLAPVTLIFSPVELNAPAFLNAAELRDLTPAEQRALNQLKRQAQARSPKTAPSAEGETMTASPAGDEPLVFEIVLRKQAKGR